MSEVSENIAPTQTEVPPELPTKGRMRRAIIDLAWPVVAELMLVSLLGMVNMIMVGHIGTNALAAVGITTQPVLISFIFFQAFNVGGTALVARAIGADNVAQAKKISALTLWLNTIVGVVIGLLTFIFSRDLVLFMGAQPSYLDDAVLYMQYSALGVMLQAIPAAVSALVRGAGNTRIPAVYNLASNIVNVIVGFVLVYLPFSFSQLGVKGVAIAQLVAKAVALVMALYAMLNNGNLAIRLNARDIVRPDFAALGKLVYIGFPAALEQLAMRAGLLIFSKLVADLGDVALAAHTINMNIQGLVFNFGAALGAAATSLAGRTLGAGEPALANAYLKETRRIGMATSLVFTVILIAIPGPISRLFTADQAVVAASAAVLWLGALMVPFQTSQLIISGGLRGAGDTVWPLVATVLGVGIVRVGAGYLGMVTLGLGLTGAWAAFLFDQVTRSVVIFLRFRTGRWQHRKI